MYLAYPAKGVYIKYRSTICVELNKNYVQDLWICFRDVVTQLSTASLHSILDEVIFKISASKETAVGRYCTLLWQRLVQLNHHIYDN